MPVKRIHGFILRYLWAESSGLPAAPGDPSDSNGLELDRSRRARQHGDRYESHKLLIDKA